MKKMPAVNVPWNSSPERNDTLGDQPAKPKSQPTLEELHDRKTRDLFGKHPVGRQGTATEDDLDDLTRVNKT